MELESAGGELAAGVPVEMAGVLPVGAAKSVAFWRSRKNPIKSKEILKDPINKMRPDRVRKPKDMP